MVWKLAFFMMKTNIYTRTYKIKVMNRPAKQFLYQALSQAVLNVAPIDSHVHNVMTHAPCVGRMLLPHHELL